MASADSSQGQHHRLSLPALLGFSLPGFALGALAVSVSVYLPHYYASHIGISLAAVGGAFGVVRLFDGGLDPILGVTMDQSRTRIGRYRPWLIVSAPVLMLGVYLLFEPPSGAGMGYLFAALAVYYVGISLMTLSHVSWASVIAGQYHERSRVFGVIQMVGVSGATLILILPILLARKGASDGGVTAMGWFIVALAPLGVFLATLRTPEPIAVHTQEDHLGWRDYWAIVSRPDVLRIFAADVCLTLGPGWMSALYLFYFHDSRGFAAGEASRLLLIYIAAGVVGALSISRLAMAIGKHRAQMAASTGYSLGLLLLTLTPKGAFWPVAAVMFGLGLLAGSFPMLDRAMMGDVADAIRLEQGKRRIGLLFAMITTAQKMAVGLSVLLSFAMLEWIGYRAKDGVANTPQAIHGLELVYLIGPVTFVMLGGACYIGYSLDAKRHNDIRAQLEERDALGVTAPILDGFGGEPTVPTQAAEAT
jgi:glycoside/pentoside/hexuronide:cation symporter, GPH family